MHFGHHRAGHAARDIVLGPEPLAPDLVGQIFENGEAIPHHHIAIPQDRHLAARRLKFAPFAYRFPFVAVERNGDLFEGEARLLGCQPAPQ